MIDCLKLKQANYQQQEHSSLQLHNIFSMQTQPNNSFDSSNNLNLVNEHQRMQASNYGAHNNPSSVYLNQQQLQQQQTSNEQQSLVGLQTVSSVKTNFPNQHQAATGNELIGYYFGSISRETSEWILKNHGNQLDGAYLLRSSGPNDDFVLSLLVVHKTSNSLPHQPADISGNPLSVIQEVLHYKIVETEDSFVALHGQIGDEKFSTIDELIEKAKGVATRPRWPILRQTLESQILPPTYWGLTVDQIRLAILLKAKQWGFPLLSPLFQASQQDQATYYNSNQNPSNKTNSLIEGMSAVSNATTLNNETIRTLIYKSLHEFQPWFHGKIGREEAERRIEEGIVKDGKFLMRERDNYSYAMCISHKKTTKHYRIDVLPTGELAIQDGRRFTSLMALVSHYTIMSDGLWCALTEACRRPIQQPALVQINGNKVNTVTPDQNIFSSTLGNATTNMTLKSHCQNKPVTSQHNSLYNPSLNQNLYCTPPNAIHSLPALGCTSFSCSYQNVQERSNAKRNTSDTVTLDSQTSTLQQQNSTQPTSSCSTSYVEKTHSGLECVHQGSITSIKAPIKEWLQTINNKWSQLIAVKSQNQSMNSFLFGNQNPLNNHCRQSHQHRHSRHHLNHSRRKCKNGHISCGCPQHNAKCGLVSSNHEQPNNNNSIRLNSNCNVREAPPTTMKPTTTCNCCIYAPANSYPPALRKQPQLSVHPRQNNESELSLNGSANIYQPQVANGFTLCTQSFVGSPLFAVIQSQSQSESIHSGSGGSGGSGAGRKHPREEEKLISPAHSVSANNNLGNNNPYKLSTDIYGSQTSTAPLEDRLPTSSSSSSGIRNLSQLRNPCQQIQRSEGERTSQMKNVDQNFIKLNSFETAQHNSNVPFNSIQTAGPIMCGQHAGPAYRYTNCNDENSYRPCSHRRINQVLHDSYNRAFDDSQLVTSATQLAGPAALTKFVQFQDGQCLRTHRDTRSIQMAYLSSRQALDSNNINRQTLSRNNNKLPCKESGGQQPYNIQRQALSSLAQLANINNNINSANNQQISHCPTLIPHGNTAKYPTTIPNMNLNNMQQPEAQSTNHQKGQHYVQSGHCFDKPDLMDCGNEDYKFEFKYDPKLIKSSSIETLCGAGEEDDKKLFEEENIFNYKTNAELMMSLQSYWNPTANQQQTQNVLAPTINYLSDSSKSSAGIDFCQQTANSNNFSTSNHNQASSNILDDHDKQLNERIEKKHDLDELTTALLAELTASLREQVDLKNKRAGLVSLNAQNNLATKTIDVNPPPQTSSCDIIPQQNSNQSNINYGCNSLELVNEFDSLIHPNR